MRQPEAQVDVTGAGTRAQVGPSHDRREPLAGVSCSLSPGAGLKRGGLGPTTLPLKGPEPALCSRLCKQ